MLFHTSLAVIENLTEFKPELCTEAANQGLLQWILRNLVVCVIFIVSFENSISAYLETY